MNHEQFIEKNIQAELKKLGFSSSYMAVDHYRRIAQASKKGRMFDDCLHIAKVWASKFAKEKTK
ncbi:hypothetical protein I4569_17845 [Proteus mirabilis]|nr:hypothetical protein [Proteus mirabilis]